MRRLLLLIVVLALAACTSTEATPATTSDDTAVDVASVPRPDEPADGETFRADHPSHVASTGRPQLIEFYADT